jgi:AraC family transcriptional regulator
MDWIDRMNCALDYIENNLEDDINYQNNAQLAHSSEYHFPRMFSSIILAKSTPSSKIR